jgi:hypothetical protein
MLQIDLEHVNAFVLRKQHLTPDSKIHDIPMVVKDIGGLHATGSTVPYLSLFARCPSFEKQLLEEELYVKKSLAKIRCIRKTIYIHTKAMIPILHAATNPSVIKASKKFMEARGVTSKENVQLSEAILEMLSVEEMTASDIKKELDTSLDISSVLYFMCDQGILVRGKPDKSWRDKSHRYARFNDYFPDLDLSQYDEQEAITLLVERYLASFGPATENDILWWIGLGKSKVRHALIELEAKVSHLSISGLKGDYLLLDSDIETLSGFSKPSRPTINLLPYLDPYLMGYKERERYLDTRDTARVFDRSGNATSTILVNGRVVGVWDFGEEERPLFKLLFFHQPSPEILNDVRHEALRLGKFIAESEVQLVDCDSMPPLIERTAGAFMSPLKGCAPLGCDKIIR